MQLPLAYSLRGNPTLKASISVVKTYYVRVSDAAVVSVFISAETETSSNCRRCLAMDVRVDSNNQPLSGTPQYFIYYYADAQKLIISTNCSISITTVEFYSTYFYIFFRILQLHKTTYFILFLYLHFKLESAYFFLCILVKYLTNKSPPPSEKTFSAMMGISRRKYLL
jgi:hypothetical protein